MIGSVYPRLCCCRGGVIVFRADRRNRWEVGGCTSCDGLLVTMRRSGDDARWFHLSRRVCEEGWRMTGEEALTAARHWARERPHPGLARDVVRALCWACGADDVLRERITTIVWAGVPVPAEGGNGEQDLLAPSDQAHE